MLKWLFVIWLDGKRIIESDVMMSMCFSFSLFHKQNENQIESKIMLSVLFISMFTCRGTFFFLSHDKCFLIFPNFIMFESFSVGSRKKNVSVVSWEKIVFVFLSTWNIPSKITKYAKFANAQENEREWKQIECLKHIVVECHRITWVSSKFFKHFCSIFLFNFMRMAERF